MEPREQEGAKKKKDLTCHLHSWQAGLTAVLFNFSDVLTVKCWTQKKKKWTVQRGKEGAMQNRGRRGRFDDTGLTGEILFTPVNQFVSSAFSAKWCNSFFFFFFPLVTSHQPTSTPVSDFFFFNVFVQ